MADLVYTPGVMPPQDSQIRQYLQQELLRLSSFLTQSANVPVFYEEPKNPKDGGLYTFPPSGTWEPGGGVGTYIYREEFVPKWEKVA